MLSVPFIALLTVYLAKYEELLLRRSFYSYESKCIPALLYGLEACPLKKSDLHCCEQILYDIIQ